MKGREGAADAPLKKLGTKLERQGFHRQNDVDNIDAK